MPGLPNLRVARRPLDTLGVLFEMLRAGVKPLLWAIVKYAGAPALLGGAGVGAFYGGFLSRIAVVETGDFSAFGWTEGVGLLVGMLGLYAAYAVSTLLCAAWTRRLADHEPLDADALWDEARVHLGTMARLWLLLLGISVLAVVGLGIVMGLAGAAAATVSEAFLVVVILLVFPALFAAMFYAAPPLMMVGQPMVSEGLGARASLRRSWTLLAGVRGGAGVLAIVVYLMVTMIGYVFMIPFYAILFGLMLWGGAGDLAGSMEKMGYAMGFVLVPLTLLPQVLYFLSGGALYYARVEETEYVGLNREVGALLSAFPEAAPPPLAPGVPSGGATVANADAGGSPGAGDSGAGGSETRPYSDPAVPFGDLPAAPPATPPPLAAPFDGDALDRWRGGRATDSPPGDAA